MLRREILQGLQQKYAIKHLAYPGNKIFRFVIILAMYALYIAISILYHNRARLAVAALATIR